MRQEAENKLAIHAGLAAAAPKAEEASIAGLHYKFKSERKLGDIEAASSDVVHNLSIINKELNFPTDGQPLTPQGPGRSVTAAVSQISEDCCEIALLAADSETSRRAQAACWRILCAWNALVAGDIEDLGRHVELEASARLPRHVK